MTEVQRGLYRHFKGSVYRVMGVAQHTEQAEPLVIYQSLEDSRVWARPVPMFMGLNDAGKPRFEFLGDEVADLDLADLTQNKSSGEYLEALYYHFLRKLTEDFEGQTLFGRLVLKRSRMRQVLGDLLRKEATINEISSDNVRSLRLLVDQKMALESQVQHLMELAESDTTSEVVIRAPKASDSGRVILEVTGEWSRHKKQFFSGRTLEEAAYRAVVAYRKGVVQV